MNRLAPPQTTALRTARRTLGQLRRQIGAQIVATSTSVDVGDILDTLQAALNTQNLPGNAFGSPDLYGSRLLNRQVAFVDEAAKSRYYGPRRNRTVAKSIEADHIYIGRQWHRQASSRVGPPSMALVASRIGNTVSQNFFDDWHVVAVVYDQGRLHILDPEIHISSAQSVDRARLRVRDIRCISTVRSAIVDAASPPVRQVFITGNGFAGQIACLRESLLALVSVAEAILNRAEASVTNPQGPIATMDVVEASAWFTRAPTQKTPLRTS